VILPLINPSGIKGIVISVPADTSTCLLPV